MSITASPHRLIRAFLRQPVDVTPVWLMRQAGRYLPEYRAIRAKVPEFMTLCKTPDLACQITLQPLARFALDGAIIFSDILTIPDAMGLGLSFVQQEGPRFANPIRHLSAIQQLPIPDPEIELSYVMDAIRLVKPALNNALPLIGFAGSPWTLAAYMIEGKSGTNFSHAKKLLYQQPVALELLLDKLAQSITLYLSAQIQAGVDAVMIFDTWGGLLTTQDYQRFSLRYIQNIITVLRKKFANIPVILFTKYGGQWLKKMLSTQCDVIGLDWTTCLRKARKMVGHAVALQGNLDPALLYTDPDCIRQAVGHLLATFGHYNGHIFNLGHGIPQDVPVENVVALIHAVHELSQPYHVSYSH